MISLHWQLTFWPCKGTSPTGNFRKIRATEMSRLSQQTEPNCGDIMTGLRGVKKLNIRKEIA